MVGASRKSFNRRMAQLGAGIPFPCATPRFSCLEYRLDGWIPAATLKHKDEVHIRDGRELE